MPSMWRNGVLVEFREGADLDEVRRTADDLALLADAFAAPSSKDDPDNDKEGTDEN